MPPQLISRHRGEVTECEDGKKAHQVAQDDIISPHQYSKREQPHHHR